MQLTTCRIVDDGCTSTADLLSVIANDAFSQFHICLEDAFGDLHVSFEEAFGNIANRSEDARLYICSEGVYVIHSKYTQKVKERRRVGWRGV